MPWCVDEAKVVNADIEVLEYVLKSGKGHPVEITEIQMTRNLWRLVESIESLRMHRNPELAHLLDNVVEEHRREMELPSETTYRLREV